MGARVLSWCPVTRLEFFTYLHHWECRRTLKGFVWSQTAIISYRTETTSQISWPQISADHAASTGSTNMALNIAVNATASVSGVLDGDTHVLAPLLACENTWGKCADSVCGRVRYSWSWLQRLSFPVEMIIWTCHGFFIYYTCMWHSCKCFINTIAFAFLLWHHMTPNSPMEVRWGIDNLLPVIQQIPE